MSEELKPSSTTEPHAVGCWCEECELVWQEHQREHAEQDWISAYNGEMDRFYRDHPHG